VASGPSRDLFLLRHAKSSWDDPLLDDFDRGLTNRGRKAARLISKWFSENGIQPDLVLCSDAVRARETLDLIQSAFGPGTTIKLEKPLYLASAGELLDRLRRIDDRVPSVLVIGHNPGLQELAMLLVPRHERRPIEEKFPTAAIAWLRLSGPWSALRPSEGDLVVYRRPADLDA
jgi:phosphohistidine phosphatase